MSERTKMGRIEKFFRDLVLHLIGVDTLPPSDE